MHWVNHLQFNPGGTRFVFLHRWRVGDKPWSTRIFTARPDGSDLRLHLDTGMVSHFDWRDDRTLLAWVKPPQAGNAFALIDVTTDKLDTIGTAVLTKDGHCSYSPDRKWVLNDTYPDKDRLQWLMLFDPKTGRRYDLNQFHSPKVFTGPTRCDLHPRWSRDGKQVCFDGCHDPQRQVYVVDVSDIVGG
jgi:Tol biopolymer transport system component